jgi:hypothetical protein
MSNINWLGREGSNLRMAESKSAALPLGYAPIGPSQGTAQEQVTPGLPKIGLPKILAADAGL